MEKYVPGKMNSSGEKNPTSRRSPFSFLSEKCNSLVPPVDAGRGSEGLSMNAQS